MNNRQAESYSPCPPARENYFHPIAPERSHQVPFRGSVPAPGSVVPDAQGRVMLNGDNPGEMTGIIRIPGPGCHIGCGFHQDPSPAFLYKAHLFMV